MKYTWIDIGAPRQELHFKPVNESEETPAFKYRTGASAKNSLKPQILATTLYDAVMKYRSNLVKEKDGSKNGQTFFDTSSWEDFKNHARLLAQFMTNDEDKIQTALNQMEKAFKTLGGKDGVEKGFNDIQELEQVLKDAGIAKNTDSNGLVPEIKIRHFLDLLIPDEISTGRGKNKQTSTQEYDMNLFIKMILGRKNRSFSKLFLGDDDSNKTPREILNGVFKREFKGRIDDAYSIFRKIVRAGNYKKNNAEVGKSEIALALFFNDCSLPMKKGDICLSVNGEDVAVEMKGANAVITNRTILYSELKGKSYEWLQGYEKSNKLPREYSDANLWKTLNLQDIDIKTSNLGQTLNDNIMRNPKLKGEQFLGLKFKILFGALLRSYFNGRPAKNGNFTGGFDMMLILDTNDEAKNTSDDSPILNKPFVKIEPNGDNWYKDGLAKLKYLYSHNINVIFLDAHGEGGFKAIQMT